MTDTLNDLRQRYDADGHAVDDNHEDCDKRIAELEQQYGNILALIHRDGGQYIQQHGWKKAAEDAVIVWVTLQRELAEERALLDDAVDMRVVDYCIGEPEIDDATADALTSGKPTEEQWKMEWSRQLRIALRAAIDAAKEKT